jgi:hypothetical protein
MATLHVKQNLELPATPEQTWIVEEIGGQTIYAESIQTYVPMWSASANGVHYFECNGQIFVDVSNQVTITRE